MALNLFYQEMPELADSLIEAYQGRYGIVTDYPFDKGIKMPKDPVKFIVSLQDYVDKNRGAVCDESELQNIIDEIVQLIDTTRYKLENLD